MGWTKGKPAHNRKNVTGKKFGKLLVLLEKKSEKRKGSEVLCKCDCGNDVVISKGDFLKRSKGNLNCGCSFKDIGVKPTRWMNPEKVGAKWVYTNLKGRAKRYGQEFALSEDVVADMLKKPCQYCNKTNSSFLNIRASAGIGEPKIDYHFRYNGVDRINSDIGYVDGNVTTCCKSCNYAKNTMTVGQFKDWIKDVYEHMYCNFDLISLIRSPECRAALTN